VVNAKPIPYVDNERDARDCTVLSSVKAAIQLIDDGESHLAVEVLRLVRDRLEASWPHTGAKFTADMVKPAKDWMLA
jgi:hypothetical protein